MPLGGDKEEELDADLLGLLDGDGDEECLNSSEEELEMTLEEL